MKLSILRIVVLLPAPFGPIRPNISPFSTLKEIFETALKFPYFLVSLFTLIISAIWKYYTSSLYELTPLNVFQITRTTKQEIIPPIIIALRAPIRSEATPISK